jgi:hypothetical protein
MSLQSVSFDFTMFGVSTEIIELSQGFSREDDLPEYILEN